mgnify:CR=1 FL=1
MDCRFLKSAYTPKQYPPPLYPEFAFAGRSNVGKSSLINRLLNRRVIAKVSSRPGKTRSLNFYLVDGKICFVDLPGYGYAEVPLKMKMGWKGMVESYLRERKNLKAVIVIVDIRRGIEKEEEQLIDFLNFLKKRYLIVFTKIDKISRSELSLKRQRLKEEFKDISVFFSAKTGEGKRELWKRLREFIKKD